MRVFIDTNVIVSAALFPNSIPARAFAKASSYPNKGIVCSQTFEEMRKTFNKKFPDKIRLMEHFIAIAITSLVVVPVSETELPDEDRIRDPKDIPLYRTARSVNADIILTGDKEHLKYHLYCLISPFQGIKYMVV